MKALRKRKSKHPQYWGSSIGFTDVDGHEHVVSYLINLDGYANNPIATFDDEELFIKVLKFLRAEND